MDQQRISTVFGQPSASLDARPRTEQPIPPEAQRAAIVRFCLGSGGYLAVIGVAVVSPLVALALTGLIAIYYVVDQTPTPTRAAAAVSG